MVDGKNSLEIIEIMEVYSELLIPNSRFCFYRFLSVLISFYPRFKSSILKKQSASRKTWHLILDTFFTRSITEPENHIKPITSPYH